MQRALSECVIEGVPTTSSYHKLILDTEDFRQGNVDTGFIPKHADELSTPPEEKVWSACPVDPEWLQDAFSSDRLWRISQTCRRLQRMVRP